VVALLPRRALRGGEGGGVALEAPSLGESQGLCAGERFAEQPAAAFCSGVLVDWDLILTAGHCVRVLPLDEIAVAFDYYYASPGVLALDSDTRRVVNIVAEALDDERWEPRLDYAWLKLDRPVLPPRRRPAPLRTGQEPLRAGDALTFIGSVGGTPVKVALAADVRDARAATTDYFVADTDTSHGSSGGAAFDRDLRLAGILARGNEDFERSAAGCAVTERGEVAEAGEEFTYVHSAVDGLCLQGPHSMCDLPSMPPAAGGCSMVSRSELGAPNHVLVLAVMAALAALRRRRSWRGQSRASRPSTGQETGASKARSKRRRGGEEPRARSNPLHRPRTAEASWRDGQRRGRDGHR
jgi:hypothetical protein